MGRSQETYNKKEVRNKKEKKRKEKNEKRQLRNEGPKASLDDMIAYVDANGVIVDTPPDKSEIPEIKAEDIIIDVVAQQRQVEDPINTGVITNYNESKGFGFIRNIKTKESLFFHVNDLLEPVKEGNLVQFIQVKGKKGMAAAEVKIKK